MVKSTLEDIAMWAFACNVTLVLFIAIAGKAWFGWWGGFP